MTQLAPFALIALLVPHAAGCAADVPEPTPPMPDVARFEAEAFPVLVRDCAFPACHGTQKRFFQVFGAGRVRMDPLLDPFDPTTPQELAYSYERARAMLLPQPHTDRSLLLTKPIGLVGGGAAHLGKDNLGRDVYQSKDDPSYRALVAWAKNESNPTPGTTTIPDAGQPPNGQPGMAP